MLRFLDTRKTDEGIAEVLELPIETVREMMKQVTGKGNSSYHLEMEKKTLGKGKGKAVAREGRRKTKEEVDEQRRLKTALEEKAREKRRLLAKQEAEREKNRRQRDKPLFETKKIDYSRMVSVRVDGRTIIYIEPDQDPEEAKRKFIESRLARSANF